MQTNWKALTRNSAIDFPGTSVISIDMRHKGLNTFHKIWFIRLFCKSRHSFYNCSDSIRLISSPRRKQLKGRLRDLLERSGISFTGIFCFYLGKVFWALIFSVSGKASTRSPVWGWVSWAVGAVYPFLLSLKGIIWMDEHGVLVLYEMRSELSECRIRCNNDTNSLAALRFPDRSGWVCHLLNYQHSIDSRFCVISIELECLLRKVASKQKDLW